MSSNLKRLAAAGTAAWILGTGAGWAAEVTAGADLNSAYVWRGMTYNDSLVFQPSVDVAGPAGLGLNVWGNFDLDDYDVDGETLVEGGNFSEVDLTLTYAIPEDVDALEFEVGVSEYLYPDGVDSTREAYAEAGYDLGGGVRAGGLIAYDFDEIDDYYANVSLRYGYDVAENLALELAGLIGYAGSDFATGGESGFHEYEVKASAAYTLSEAAELGAFLAYTDAVDDDVLADTDVNLFGGISAYYSF